MKLQFIKELIRNNNTVLFPQNTCTNTNCYSCGCSQCKEKWTRATESLGAYTFPVTDGLVTAKGHLLHTAGHPQHYSQKFKRQPPLPPNTQLLKKFPGTWCCCRCPRTSPTSPFTCWATVPLAQLGARHIHLLPPPHYSHERAQLYPRERFSSFLGTLFQTVAFHTPKLQNISTVIYGSNSKAVTFLVTSNHKKPSISPAWRHVMQVDTSTSTPKPWGAYVSFVTTATQC